MTKSLKSVVPASLPVTAVRTEWRKAFDAQVTAELYATSLAHAHRLTARLAKVCRHADDQYASELVQSAIVDTLLGSVTWDPVVCSLQDHVLRTMQSRCHNDRVRARAAPHVQLDTCDADGVVALIDEVGSDDGMHIAAALRIDSLRDVAVGNLDDDAVAVLSFVNDGPVTPRAIAAAMGWRRKRARNALVRLRRYLKDLPRPTKAAPDQRRARAARRVQRIARRKAA